MRTRDKEDLQALLERYGVKEIIFELEKMFLFNIEINSLGKHYLKALTIARKFMEKPEETKVLFVEEVE